MPISPSPMWSAGLDEKQGDIRIGCHDGISTILGRMIPCNEVSVEVCVFLGAEGRECIQPHGDIGG